MLNSVQYLRGIAALMVVVFHALAPSARLGADAEVPVFYAGQGGVDLFFVISGFIIWHTTQSDGTDPWRFLVRRLKRVVPLYWVLTLLMAFVALAVPSLMQTTEFDLQHLIASLLFIPWPHPNIDASNPVLFVGWSLNYEMAFYLVFALLIVFTPYVRGLLAVLFGLAFVGLGLAVSDDGPIDFYTAPVILEFLFGILIAMAYSRPWRLPMWVSAALVIGGFAALLLLASPDLDRVVWAGLPSLAIMTGAVFWERERATKTIMLPLLVGSASYSIYLSHVFVLPVSQEVWTLLLPDIAGWWIVAYGIMVTSACLGAGIMTYLMLEIPLSHAADFVDDKLSSPRDKPAKRLVTRYLQALRP